MKKILLIPVLIFGVVTLVNSQTRIQGNAGGATGSISGIYSLYRIEDLDKGPVGRMVISIQKGERFLIWGIGWGGEGKVEGEKGYYDWKFDDGRTGRTTFVINSDGTLKGHVLGSGLDWWYLARRESTGTSARDPGTQIKIDYMIQAIRDKNSLSPDVVMDLLVRMWGKEIIPDLIELLQDKDGALRYQAAVGLGKLGAIEALPQLRGLLMDEDGSARAGGATAIGLLGFRNEAVIYLKKLLNDKSPEVRGKAANGLGELRIKEAIPDIVNLLKEAIPNFADLLKEGHYRMFWDVMSAVDKLRAREAIPELLKIFKESKVNRESPDRLVSFAAESLLREAVSYLGNLGAKEAAQDFIKLLNDNNSVIRTYTVEALGQVGAKEAIPDLIKLLRNEKEASVRRETVLALGRLDAKEAIPDLIQFLSDKEDSVRINTVYALGKLGARESIPELVKLLKDPKGNIRGLTAIVLVEFGAKDKVPQEIIKDI